MFSGGASELAGPIIGGVGSMLSGACGDDEGPPKTQFMGDNPTLARALAMAKMKQKFNSPMRPNLPQFSVNPTPGMNTGVSSTRTAY